MKHRFYLRVANVWAECAGVAAAQDESDVAVGYVACDEFVERAEAGEGGGAGEGVDGVGRGVLGLKCAVGQWQFGGVLMQALAHELLAGQYHAADVCAVGVHAVDGGGGACAEDDVLLLSAQHLRAEQLGVAVAAHLGWIGIGEFEFLVLSFCANQVLHTVGITPADELLDLAQYVCAGDAADAAAGRCCLRLPKNIECVQPIGVVVRECGGAGVGGQWRRVLVKVPFDAGVADVDEQCGHGRARSCPL